MGTIAAADAETENQTRASSRGLVSTDSQRDFLPQQRRLPVASIARRIWPLENRLSLLSTLEPKRALAGDQRQIGRPHSPSGRPETTAQCGDHRQPIRQDNAKKGARGYDAGKKVKGRKRHLLVDTMGMVLSVLVHSAGIQDRDGARLAVEQIKRYLTRVRIVFADGAYGGQLVDWLRDTLGWKLEIVKRSDQAQGFEVLPKRWIVERTFGWLNLYRRHSRDYEERPEHSEAMIYLTMIRIMIRRLAKQKTKP